MYAFLSPTSLLANILCVSAAVHALPTLEPREIPEPGPLLRRIINETGGWGGGMCAEMNDFSTENSRHKIWYNGAGGDLVEYYLRNEGMDKHDNVDWAQDIFKILFPNRNPAQMSCSGSESQCGVGDLDCKEDFFNGKVEAWPSAFYTFVSLGNIHTYFAQYLERLTWLKGNLTNSLPILVDDFGVDKETEEKINPYAILAGALGMVAGASVANPGISGTAGALGGISAVVAETLPKDKDSPFEKLGKVNANLATIIGNTCEAAYKSIVTIEDAIHGRDGTNEDMIPKEMLFVDEYSKDYQHNIAKVMGNGVWLLDHPDQDLRPNFEEVGRRMMQTLALQLVRIFRKATLLILTEGHDPNNCKDGSYVWDPDRALCYALISVDNPMKIYTLQENTDFANPLFGKYGADKLIMYRNIIDCWLENGNQVGVPDISVVTPGTDIKRCFFSVEVKMGAYKSYADELTGVVDYLELVPEEQFPNFSKSDKDKNGGFPSACRYRTWDGAPGENCRSWPWAFDL